MAKRLTPATVAKMLKGKGLSASPKEIAQVTNMLNDELEREAEAAGKAAAHEKQGKAVDRFFAEFWKPVEKERKKR